MGLVIVIPADGTKPIRSRETDTPPTLPELQALVGGFIELVPHWSDYMGMPADVWCNEDGKPDQLPVNVRATALWYEKLGQRVDDILVGEIVLVVGLPDREEE